MLPCLRGVVVASLLLPVGMVGQDKVVLPIRRVSLYKNGVGYFEHAGTVRGDQSVRIDFTTAQLNDVLGSLTAVDLGGGRVAGAEYNSTTPLEQQLRSLPLGLSADPTSVELYQALRGARVEVVGAGPAMTGRILNLELRQVGASSRKEDEGMVPVAQRHYLTVVSDAGSVRTVELNGTTSVRLLDGGLRGDVERYLKTLAGNHADGLRHLTLVDKGTGARELRVSYISEVPVWKCTYRVLMDGGTAAKTATLQGWALIDNTVGTDWDKVQLSLVSGAPQSFLQPISQPYYARRPEVGLPEEAQLTPQTHESGEGEAPVSSGVVGAGMGPSGGIMGGLGLNGLPVTAHGSGENLAVRGRFANGGVGGNGPMAQGVGVGIGSGFGEGMGPGGGHGTGGGFYAPSPVAYEDSASASVAPRTTTASFDDYFEYTLNEPVTIKKNESALVPILQAKVDVDPVTLWSPNEARPLRALWVKNTSGRTLDRGSFSIVEGGNFSGQGLLDPIHPGERRLLSYAADSAVRVSVDYRHDTRRLQQVTIAKGILREKTTEVAELEYLVHNAAAVARTVIVEQPRREGWELDSEPKPEETTASAYRFRVMTGPGETVRLDIGERHTLTTRVELANFDENRLTVLLRQNGDPTAILAALQPVFAAKRRLAELDGQIAQRNGEMTTIAADQSRLRENLKALKGTAEERDLTRRYTGELNAQEDRLGVLKAELGGLQAQRQAAQEAVAHAIEALNVDQTLG